MSNITFTTNGIERLLKPGKAAGPDDIPTWILKICAVQVAPILQVIFPVTQLRHLAKRLAHSQCDSNI